MTCPLCGREHPAGTTWCPVLFQDVAHLVADAAPEPPADRRADAAAQIPDTERVMCPNCGAGGRPGAACIQCMEIIPLPAAATKQLRPVYVVLPSMHAVAIPRGSEVAIGRQSTIAALSRGLEAFDGVSRHHCFVKVDTERDTATIRDLGSLNHTWVGDEAHELRAEERLEVALPVRLRLGQTAYLTITTEGV